MNKHLVFVLILIGIPLHLNAQMLPDDSKLAEDGWQILSFDNKTPNRFEKIDNAISVATQQSVSVLFQNIEVDLTQTPTLSWSWKVTEPVAITDLTQKGRDDRALALYVNFPFDAENAGFWEHMVRSMVVAVKGEDAPGRVITYVWGDDEDIGSVLESPYMKSAGAMVILQKASSFGDEWIEQNVNVFEDYKRFFGTEPLNPYQIAISADTDDTQGRSQGFVKDIRFK